ncbi:MAG TPA: formylglycine-generating enzyme family protein [Polyangiaceae bacterium]|nr:formylglycine-generating enzyme family protein [Polyangiaceae bacterium]
MDRAARVAVTALALAGCKPELPPLGEAVLVVDTDLPVPMLAGELRIDLYTVDPASGGAERWYQSRTLALPDPRDWPVSFSVFNPDDEGRREALVRLRTYPRGRLRDYRGERFLPPPAPSLPLDAPYRPPEAPVDEGPRLVVDGVDVTPAAEPQPGVTVDRLVKVALAEGEVGQVEVTLRGDCVGTMADLFGARSCEATERVLAPIADAVLEPRSSALPSVQGSFWPSEGCTDTPPPPSGAPYHDERVCVPGGAFIFGNLEAFGIAEASGVPERFVALPPFWIDRYEVTVARLRRAYAEGLAKVDDTPTVNDEPFDPAAEPNAPTFCTYTTAPGPREDHPVNCVSRATAESFCRFLGGELPSEAQWEYVAQVAGRDRETPYPWGVSEPRCDTVVYAVVDAGVSAVLGGNKCVAPDKSNVGPAPVTRFSHEGGDVSIGLGVVGLGGNVHEHVRDDFLALDTVFWIGAPLRSPVCVVDSPLAKSMRGGAWSANASVVYSGLRNKYLVGDSDLFTTLGFRCVWPATP